MGLGFVLDGYVKRRTSWTDEGSREPKYGVQVDWIGGSKFVFLTPELFEGCPEQQGAPVLLKGDFEITKDGVRLDCKYLKSTDPNGKPSAKPAA